MATSTNGQSTRRSLRRAAANLLGRNTAFQIDYRLGREWGRLTWRWREVRRPVFLWGAGRTGSYLLYDILSLHPEFVCARNPRRLSKGLYGTHHHGGGDYDHLFANPFPPVEGFKRHFLNRYPEIRENLEVTSTQQPAVLRSFRQLVGSTWRPRRLLDKAPQYTFLLDLLENLFPTAQHIHCLRHPEAVAASYVRRMREPNSQDRVGIWGWRPPGWESIVDWNVESRAVWLAVQTIRAANENHRRLGQRCIDVRYETLVADPHPEVQRVYEFLAVAPQPEVDNLLPERFPDFSKPLTEADRGQLRSDVREDLERLVAEFDYPPLG